MYKLVAIDVDGTLVNDDKKLTQRTIDSIKKASQKDIKIVISSARSFYWLKNYLEQLELIKNNQYTIYNMFNGAVIIENKNQKIMLSNNFDIEEIWELINLANKLNTSIFLYSINIYKIFFVNDYEKIAKIRKTVPKELSEKYEITNSIPECIEFVKKGITKSKSLQFICEKCNIKNSEVIAIGDANNDTEMINFVGIGVAMGKAEVSLKEKADDITSSNNHDGVAKVIEKYILKNEKIDLIW